MTTPRLAQTAIDMLQARVKLFLLEQRHVCKNAHWFRTQDIADALEEPDRLHTIMLALKRIEGDGDLERQGDRVRLRLT